MFYCHSEPRSATWMMVSLFFFGELLLLLFRPVSSLGQDPCHSHSELNNPYRSIAYVATFWVDTMICDVDIISGWYRFVNEVGGEIPGFKKDKYHCRTVAPIWMQGPHPSEANGVVDRAACADFNNMFPGCLSFTTKVKNCSSFYVLSCSTTIWMQHGLLRRYVQWFLQPCCLIVSTSVNT